MSLSEINLTAMDKGVVSNNHEGDLKQNLKAWLVNRNLGHLYQALVDGGLGLAELRDLDSTTLNHFLEEAGVQLKDRVHLVHRSATIPPERDNIVLYSPDSNTNPDDSPTEFLVGWAKAIGAGGIGLLLPCFAVGFSSETTSTGDDGAGAKFKVLSDSEQLYQVFIPAIVIFVLFMALTPKISMALASDVMEERSSGMEFKEAYVNSLTTSGIVAALLLTCVLSAMQAGFPAESEQTLIAQWYGVFLCMGFFYSVTATAMSTICLTYLHPLNEAAVQDFVSIMALYFGEPLAAILMCCCMLLNATCLYSWGLYGTRIGVFMTICAFLAVFRTLSSQHFLAIYKNPHVDAEERARRQKVIVRGSGFGGALAAH
jgi:hypothetical protein